MVWAARQESLGKGGVPCAPHRSGLVKTFRPTLPNVEAYFETRSLSIEITAAESNCPVTPILFAAPHSWQCAQPSHKLLSTLGRLALIEVFESVAIEILPQVRQAMAVRNQVDSTLVRRMLVQLSDRFQPLSLVNPMDFRRDRPLRELGLISTHNLRNSHGADLNCRRYGRFSPILAENRSCQEAVGFPHTDACEQIGFRLQGEIRHYVRLGLRSPCRPPWMGRKAKVSFAAWGRHSLAATETQPRHDMLRLPDVNLNGWSQCFGIVHDQA